MHWFPRATTISFLGLSLLQWAALLVLILLTNFLQRRYRRPNPGHCKKCDYDLTGNLSGVCPECGERI
jgi:hypothetical protein